MSNGHIIEFLKNAPPDTDRVSLVGTFSNNTFECLTIMRQMLDVAMGVKYLHENRIVHGDLKGVSYLCQAPVLYSPIEFADEHPSYTFLSCLCGRFRPGVHR
jgi:serine/threonine protein kinase